MNITDIIYLKNILGEEETKKYLKADEMQLKMLIEILKYSNIKTILDTDTLNKFCYKIVYAKYGKTLGKMLCSISEFRLKYGILLDYKNILYHYIDSGSDSEDQYKKIFEMAKAFDKISYFPFPTDYYKVLANKEVEEANKDKITIENYIQNGGSLDEIIKIIKESEIEEFTKDSKISVSLPKTNNYQRYEVNITQIGYLVSLISRLNLDEETQTELLEVYYNGLEQSKQNGFITDVLEVENKPNLYKLLESKGFVVNVLENKTDKESSKLLKKEINN